MTSFDTNVLFPACDRLAKDHHASVVFLNSLIDRSDVCICEQVLMEVYCLLRNPKISKSPLSASDAAKVINIFRSNPAWKIVDVVQSEEGMNGVWTHASKYQFAFRRIYDCRMAMTLRQHHVTEFATRNLKDFRDQGFERIWDPFQV